MRRPWLALLFGVFAALAPALARGQTGLDANRAEGTVEGTGTAAVKQQPDTLRLHIDLLAKARTLRDALAKLKERREAARLELIALKVDEASIEFAEPKIQVQSDEQRRMMQMLVQQRLQGPSRRRPADAPKPPVTVSMSLKAEWPIKYESIEELLILSHELQEKIREADLAGLKEAEELSPEEQELAEEMEQMRSSYGSGEEQPGEPTFLFVAAVSGQQRAAATAEAFRKARDQATQLAEAAGAQLGSLRHLSSQRSAQLDYNDYMGYGNLYRLAQQQMATPGASEPAEAVGPRPGTVSYEVIISASFALLTPSNEQEHR